MQWNVSVLYFCTTTFIYINIISLLLSPERSRAHHHPLPSMQILHNNHKHIIQVHQSCLRPWMDVYICQLCSPVFHSTFSLSRLIIFSPMIYSVILTSLYRSNNLSECTCISSLLAAPMFRTCSYGKIKAFCRLAFNFLLILFKNSQFPVTRFKMTVWPDELGFYTKTARHYVARLLLRWLSKLILITVSSVF